MLAPKIRIVESKVIVRNAFTRLPFRFGVVTMEAAPVGVLECRVEFEDGSTQTGYASDILAYKWFDKNPQKSPADNVADLLLALRTARSVYAQCASDTPYNLWFETRQEIEDRALANGFNRLGASFAASMMERAVMDAVGRHLSLSFDQMVRKNILGIRPNALFSEVGFDQMIGALPQKPLTQVALRHTVGLVDAISNADKPSDAPDDGLPVTLEDYIAVDKLNYLKLKLSGNSTADIERLGAIAQIIDRSGRQIQITLDGNEQYDRLNGFVDLVDQIRSTPALEKLWASVLFIEQPLHRDVAMATPLSKNDKRAIGRPLLIDEADGWAEAYFEAIELGYEGVSHKNCKGVYRSLINAGLAKVRNDGLAQDKYFLSAEDLTNLPVVPLQADLAVIATLGIPHVERNGHHYFAGLKHLPDAECQKALENHAALYKREGNTAVLRIENGMLDIASLQVPGLGVVDVPDMSEGYAEENWRFSMLEKN